MAPWFCAVAKSITTYVTAQMPQTSLVRAYLFNLSRHSPYKEHPRAPAASSTVPMSDTLHPLSSHPVLMMASATAAMEATRFLEVYPLCKRFNLIVQHAQEIARRLGVWSVNSVSVSAHCASRFALIFHPSFHHPITPSPLTPHRQGLRKAPGTCARGL